MSEANTDTVLQKINPESLARTLCSLVDIASPTGEEGTLAGHIAALLTDFGATGSVQKIDDQQSNAVGQLAAAKRNSELGKALLLYAPIDTVTSNSEEEDLPWLAKEMPHEARAQSRFDGTHVFGLGAHNPKGHAACILEAARVLSESGIALANDLFLGFGAGGMPTNARVGTRENCGHGAGCQYMLDQGSRIGFNPEVAIIAKSGWSISYEEVGLTWFEVWVHGTHNYSGARHLMPYRNPIVDAARLIQQLDEWLAAWPERHRSGLVAPQGVVSFIESGWERMPSFTPEVCRLRIDLRLSPRTRTEEAEADFARVLADICADLNIEADFRRIVSIPGTSTPLDDEVIRKTIGAWERVTHSQHEFVSGLSGATDANILRLNGLPTARVGLPKADLPSMDFQLGMNAVALEDLVALTKVLVLSAISICGSNTVH
ncbi:MAG: peptidase dimerization domain-containing protein [Pseudomonadota bacterium]